jgi:hypothetical protein
MDDHGLMFDYLFHWSFIARKKIHRDTFFATLYAEVTAQTRIENLYVMNNKKLSQFPFKGFLSHDKFYARK